MAEPPISASTRMTLSIAPADMRIPLRFVVPISTNRPRSGSRLFRQWLCEGNRLSPGTRLAPEDPATTKKCRSKTRVSLASPPSQNLLPQRIVLRHRVAVIDTVTLKLRLERLPAVCDRPHVLRPNTALLDAEDPLGETVGQQPKSFGAGIYAYCIAKRLAETWRTRRVPTEIAGVPPVLRIAVIGWLHRSEE